MDTCICSSFSAAPFHYHTTDFRVTPYQTNPMDFIPRYDSLGTPSLSREENPPTTSNTSHTLISFRDLLELTNSARVKLIDHSHLSVDFSLIIKITVK